LTRADRRRHPPTTPPRRRAAAPPRRRAAPLPAPRSLAFAALTFNHDNGFDARVFSLGAALFFVTFAAFQVRRRLGGLGW
jgi:hypothetical protein